MASMGVSFVVPRMTPMASFSTLSSFSRLDCNTVNDAEYHTLIQQEQIALFDVF